MSTFAVPAVAWRGTEFTTRFTMDNAEAQHEVFALLDFAGRRFPVVFSHFSLNNLFNNKTRKGAFNQLSHSALDASMRRSINRLTKEVTNSLPVTGRLASTNMSSTNNNSFLTFFNNHNKD